jgi:hypothetical protein
VKHASVVAALAVSSLASMACARGGHRSLDVGGDDGGDGGAPAQSGAPAPASTSIIHDKSLCVPGTPTVRWSPLRRVSRVEYDNMVRDLLGDATQPALGFVPESPMTRGVNFETNTYTSASTLVAQQYQQAAEALAETAVGDAASLARILPCTTQDDACARQFIATFANRAFRGQLDSTESSDLLQLYSDVKAQFDFGAGIQAVITAVLESPRFLYVLEFGQGAPTGDAVALAPSELAGRLAFFIWRSVPDAALMAAAASGQLATSAGLQAQAARMLADPKAKDALDDFTTQWMELQNTPTLGKDSQYKAWQTYTGAELKYETLADFSQLVLAADGGLGELLTSTSSYLTPNLAQGFYNATAQGTDKVVVTDPVLGALTFYRTDLSAGGRAGILTTAGVLATQAHTTLPSTVLRGKLVREQILCDPIPPPPPGVPPPASSVPDGGTTRAVFTAHETVPGCVSCHQFMDPVGFAFGHFDATGAFQATDANGFSGTFPPIDATGQVMAKAPGELAVTFDGATDLVTKLANAAQVQECFAIQELRYALGRVETTADACSAQQAFDAFSGSKFNVQRLLVALVGTDAFRYRAQQMPGSACQ